MVDRLAFKVCYNFRNLNYGKIAENIMVSPRVAPHIVGLGLLEAIAKEDILALADSADLNQDGISGRPNYITEATTGHLVIGRFGWKANEPSVKQQVAAAFRGDMGLTSSIFPKQNDTENQGLTKFVNGGNPEVTDDILDRVTLYSQALAVPQRRNAEDKNIIKGEMLFSEIGCQKCHI